MYSGECMSGWCVSVRLHRAYKDFTTKQKKTGHFWVRLRSKLPTVYLFLQFFAFCTFFFAFSLVFGIGMSTAGISTAVCMEYRYEYSCVY